MPAHILRMDHIGKEFPGVKALDDVSLEVEEGEIHALVGENGAGKSTLMNILSGVYPHGSYSGEIHFLGEACRFQSIRDSEKRGIVIIHQELALIPYLSVQENIFLGNERQRGGVIDWNRAYSESLEVLRRVGLDEPPTSRIADIGVGKQQLVEIAKALAKNVKLLILDEPTSALNEQDSENLLNLLFDLKNHGITSILISHKLREVDKVADSITILRDGKTIETLKAGAPGVDENRIIKGMVGRDMTQRFPERDARIGDVVFEVRDWTVHHPQNADRVVIDNVGLKARRGEVVGIAGLMGAGRTEFAMSLFGRSYGARISGQVFKNGREIHLKTVSDAIANGIAYVTEDRKTLGLVLDADVRTNLTMAGLARVMRNFLVVDRNREIVVAEEYRAKFGIKTPSVFQKVVNLSGGNQQKVVLSKWIFTDPDVLILDEPTRGIDVGAKYEIYSIINDLAGQGKAVILISSEMPEILGMCDRIYVMSDGRMTGLMDKATATSERIMKSIVENKEHTE